MKRCECHQVSTVIQITCVDDAALIKDDPVLHREVMAYLAACRAECDSADDNDIDFVVLSEEDLPMLAELGEPEELADIEIHTGNQVRRITRMVFVTTVYFINGVTGDERWWDS